MHYLSAMPVSGTIATHTHRDKILSRVYDFTLKGWPDNTNDNLKPFFKRNSWRQQLWWLALCYYILHSICHTCQICVFSFSSEAHICLSTPWKWQQRSTWSSGFSIKSSDTEWWPVHMSNECTYKSLWILMSETIYLWNCHVYKSR